ncbi:hypothetical protein [Streptosporangium sp. NPDC006007]
MTRALVAVLLLAGCTATPSGPPVIVRTGPAPTPFITVSPREIP